MKYFPVFKRKITVKKNVTSAEIANALSKIQNIRVAGTDHNFVQCYKQNPSIIYHNSFLPGIDMTLVNKEEITEINCAFHLRKTVQIIHYVYNLLALIFQIVALVCNWGAITLPCFVPVLLIVYANLLVFLGLFCQVRKITDEINWQTIVLEH